MLKRSSSTSSLNELRSASPEPLYPRSDESLTAFRTGLFHSSPVLPRPRRPRLPFKGDLSAWSSMSRSIGNLSIDSSTTSICDPRDDWWIVQLTAAPPYDPRLQPRDGRIPLRQQIAGRLHTFGESLLANTPIVLGERIRTTDTSLTRIRPTGWKTPELPIERGRIAREHFRRRTRRTRKPKALRIAPTIEEVVDSDCDPEDDLCTCKKCRTLTE